jgi:hypothetical protein
MANRPEIYIGGDNSPNGAWGRGEDGPVLRYLAGADKWSFVRANVDGYYLNNFAFLEDQAWISQMAGILGRKAVMYETDMKNATRDEDQNNIRLLKTHFDQVPYAVLNRHDDENPDGSRYSQDRIDGLNIEGGRPILAQQGPWVVDGGINTPKAATWREAIGAMQGTATDGPLGLWFNNEGNMQQATLESVQYAHDRGKLAMVMLATHTCGSDGNVLRFGEECVRWLEQRGGMPDIWAISYYHFEGFHFEVTPESNDAGSPAGTVAGLAYWLINHLRKPRRVSTWPHQAPVRHAQWRKVSSGTGHVLLENRSLQSYLEVKNNNQADAAEVGTYAHNRDTSHAHWTLAPFGDDFVILDRNVGRSLQVDEASTQPNARVSVYPHIPGTEHALWRMTDRGDGWFSLSPKHNPTHSLQIDVSARV